MNKVKQPKKPLLFYYLIVMAAPLLNLIAIPQAAQSRIQEAITGEEFMRILSEGAA